MTTVDWIIVGIAVMFGGLGSRRGLLVGLLSLSGFVIGAIVGARVGPALLTQGSASPWAPVFGLAGAMALGTVASGLAELVAWRVRSVVRGRVLRALDGLGGAVLAIVVALGMSWIAGAVAVQAPVTRAWHADLRASQILQRLNAVLPPSGSILNALAKVDPFPQLAGPKPEGDPPDPRIAGDATVLNARGSIVRITGIACGLGVSGTGWVIRPGFVVTNAHVVAGEQETAVRVGGNGVPLDATLVAFDARNDVAILAVPSLTAPELTLADQAAPDTTAATLGFPGNGGFDVRAARLGRSRATLTEDAYGQGPVRRTILPFRGHVRPGNSGGPIIDRTGRVVGTVFAQSVGDGPDGGYAVPNNVVLSVFAGVRGPVTSGPCTRS